MTNKEAQKVILFLEFACEVQAEGNMYNFSTYLEMHEGKKIEFSIHSSKDPKVLLSWFRANYQNVRRIGTTYFSLVREYNYKSFYYRGFKMTESQRRIYKGLEKLKPDPTLERLRELMKNFKFIPPSS